MPRPPPKERPICRLTSSVQRSIARTAHEDGIPAKTAKNALKATMEPVVSPARIATTESAMTGKQEMELVSAMLGSPRPRTALTVPLVIMERTAKNVLSAITTGNVRMERKAMEAACVKRGLILPNSATIVSAATSEVIASNVVQAI